jgi:DNA-binding response OmpR family regulator
MVSGSFPESQDWRIGDNLVDAAYRSDNGDIRVLIVEDDPTLRSTLAFDLTREGYRVLTAGSGQAALDVVEDQGASLDLVILDVMLPGMSGMQVLRNIRAHLDVAVVLLSARGEEQDKVDGFELGADDYVVKPFALRELLARVRAAVRRSALPSARPSGVLMRGPLSIWPDRRCAAVNGGELRLRPKEFGLLVTLTMEPGRLFCRQDLLDLVWGDDVIVEERTVDVHISWLRAKLQAAGMSQECIRTVYGAGYRFVLDDEPIRNDGPTDGMPNPAAKARMTGLIKSPYSLNDLEAI